MTCILGMRCGGVSYLAADSRARAGNEITSDERSKIVRCGRWIIGASGPARLLDILEIHAEALGGAVSVQNLVGTLGDFVRADHWAPVPHQNGGPQAWGVALLVGAPEGLWHVGDYGYAVTPTPSNRPVGIGSGSEYGMGAAFAAMHQGLGPGECLHLGIEAAIAYDSGCGGLIRLEAAGLAFAAEAAA